MAQAPGVVIRADLTNDELTALRKVAIDKGVRVSALVGAALRFAYPLTPKEQSE
jgi:hypothetical protein